MFAATDRFFTEIRRSHRVYAYVDVISPSNEIIRLPATDGDVKVDRTAAIRRACSIKCIDPLGVLTPRTAQSILTPFGTEIRPYRGVQYADGTIEALPLGVFRLAKATVEDAVGGQPEIVLEAFDRSRTVARARFAVPYVIPEATNIVDAIKSIIDRSFPGITYDAITSPSVTTAPQFYDAGTDPWEVATSLATNVGCELYFDVDGSVVLAPPDDVNALPQPSFTYIEGQGCTMLNLSQVYTDEPGYNGIIVTGESPGDELPPVRGEAWDENPASPTYRLGPYGEVPLFHNNPLAKTAEEAKLTAETMLSKRLGFSAQLSLSAMVNPAFEGGDIIQVQRARSSVDGLYVVDAFSVPLLKGGTQGLTLRQKVTIN